MTLSLTTLNSCPLPDEVKELDSDSVSKLVKKLEQSEEENLVVKMNAGKGNESVKHSADLVLRLTKSVAPQYAEALALTHRNSHITQ